jgi:hypothetical protein
VFAAHGSGTGSGLVAARMLVDTLAAGREPSAYVTHWMRTYGALHCTFDLFRRFSQTLSAEDIALMIERGLLDDSSARAGIEQRWPDLGFRSSVRTLRAAARAPSVTARLARYLALAPVAAGLCRAFPDDPRAHDAAFKRVRQVFSSLPR